MHYYPSILSSNSVWCGEFCVSGEQEQRRSFDQSGEDGYHRDIIYKMTIDDRHTLHTLNPTLHTVSNFTANFNDNFTFYTLTESDIVEQVQCRVGE